MKKKIKVRIDVAKLVCYRKPFSVHPPPPPPNKKKKRKKKKNKTNKKQKNFFLDFNKICLNDLIVSYEKKSNL